MSVGLSAVFVGRCCHSASLISLYVCIGGLWAHAELREAPKQKNDKRLKLPVRISWFGAPGTHVGGNGQPSKEGEATYDDLDEVIAR